MNRDTDKPAILGGTPVRPHGPPDWPGSDPEVAERIQAALRDGSWGKYHGPHVGELSALLAAIHGCEHAILCASGTAAVELALRGLGVGAGDEVVLAAYDFKGNFQDVLALGAQPVLVDVLPGQWVLDASQFARAITPQTKVVIASHLHGAAVDMPAVIEIAARHDVGVLEDAAQMPGARVHGRTAGTWGDAGVLSFGGSKLVTAGRGGAVLTSRADVAQRIKLFTQRGNDAYPLSELQAAAVIPQWCRLEAAHARRTAAVCWLARELAGLEGLKPATPAGEESQPAHYKLGFCYDPTRFAGLTRDLFATAVRAEGIALDPGFRALHRTHSSRRFRAAGDLPHASLADESVLTLHHPVLLGSEADLREVVTAIELVGRHAEEIAARGAGE